MKNRTKPGLSLFTLISLFCASAVAIPPVYGQTPANSPKTTAAQPAPGTAISSAQITTLGKFSFQYGRLDISVKIPRTADGLYPALRLVGTDYRTAGWPNCGEITLLEMGHSSGITAKTQTKLFSSSANWGAVEKDGSYPHYRVFKTNTYSLQYGAFHLITLIWSRQRIRVYLDLDKIPAEQRTQATPYFDMEITPELERYFNKPFSIMLNIAAGGDYTGIRGEDKIDDVTALNRGNNFQTAMLIEYIRAYDPQGKLLFNDDFNGTRLDNSKWNVEEGVGNKPELQNYRRGNVRVEKDRATGKNCLILSTRRENL
jgi:beta-glucanase (GH16 family)